LNPDNPGRLRFLHAHGTHLPESLCQVVDEGLSAPQKSLPCRYFYDSAGSHLFEAICRLPEYYLTRTEQGILECHAPAILEAAGRNLALVEFGSGSSYKTRILLNSARRRQPCIHYVPIDISSEFLRDSSEVLLEEYEEITITAIAGEYRDGIRALPDHDGPRLILFLGSNIGNFDSGEAVEFIRDQYRHCKPILVLKGGKSLVESAGVKFTLPSGELDPGVLYFEDQDCDVILPQFIEGETARLSPVEADFLVA